MNNMYHIFAESKKGKYGLFSNYIYFMKSMKAWDKKLFYSQVFVAIPTVIAVFVETLLPSALVQGLENSIAIGPLLLKMGALALIMWITGMLASAMESYAYEHYNYFPLYFMKKYVAKIMDMDYELLEDEKFKPVRDNVWGTARHGRGISNAVVIFPEFVTSFLGILVYGILLCMQSPWIVLLIMVSLSIDLYLLGMARKKHKQLFEKISKYAKRADYISMQSMDSSAGKDIRIYHCLDWFLKKYDAALTAMGGLYSSIHNWYLFRSLSAAVLEFLRDGLAYGLLVYFLVSGRIDAAGFVLYIGLVSRFSVSFETLLRDVMQFSATSTSIGYIREFEDISGGWGDVSGVGKAEMERMRKAPVEITLRNVSYTYQGNEKPTLSHINLTIRPGEKLALIGLNGAGKTTLVKLLCGFYEPDEGEILINKIPLKQFSREEYYSLIAVLFQDATLLPTTVDENITGDWIHRMDGGSTLGDAQGGLNGNHNKAARLERALRLSGFQQKYDSLPHKGDTHLVKMLHEDAVDFSGGELQKLLFARAIYKDAPFTILDEPTAALDPIAENELYQHYGEAMSGRTSLYISHRLSSTRFCDRIVLLENGTITEEGTHESLLAADTRYAELFEMQSKYYKEQEERKQRSAIMDDEYIHDEEAERRVFSEQA